MKLNKRSNLEMDLLGFSISSARVFFLEKPKSLGNAKTEPEAPAAPAPDV